MVKITDQNYKLKEVMPSTWIKNLGTGTTLPILAIAVDENGEKIDCVIKCVSAQRMSPEASCRELIASFIAIELDLNVPEPLIVNIHEEFVSLVDQSNPCFEGLKNSIGINYGCVYIDGHWEFTSNQSLDSKLNKTVNEIFVFDLLISNPDRRIEKPNMFTNGEQIVIFDHELAFSFLKILFFQNDEPWLIKDSDINWIKDHYFYDRIKGKFQDFTHFVDKFSVLNDHFWERCYQHIPNEWKERCELEKIRMIIDKLVLHKEDFKQELKRILL